VLYVVIEDFCGGDPVPVYRRLREDGRALPDGLAYVGSWVTSDLGRCYQVMECDDPALLERWMERWHDLVAFEVVPVMSSEAAAAAVADRL
jgi:hypothetical protein